MDASALLTAVRPSLQFDLNLWGRVSTSSYFPDLYLLGGTGNPPGGRFFSSAFLIMSRQSASIFNSSGAGPGGRFFFVDNLAFGISGTYSVKDSVHVFTARAASSFCRFRMSSIPQTSGSLTSNDATDLVT